jgi:hypothetical protein
VKDRASVLADGVGQPIGVADVTDDGLEPSVI